MICPISIISPNESIVLFNPSVTHNYSKTSKLQTAILASVGSVLFLFIVAMEAVVLALTVWKKLKRRYK